MWICCSLVSQIQEWTRAIKYINLLGLMNSALETDVWMKSGSRPQFWNIDDFMDTFCALHNICTPVYKITHAWRETSTAAIIDADLRNNMCMYIHSDYSPFTCKLVSITNENRNTCYNEYLMRRGKSVHSWVDRRDLLESVLLSPLIMIFASYLTMHLGSLLQSWRILRLFQITRQLFVNRYVTLSNTKRIPGV